MTKARLRFSSALVVFAISSLLLGTSRLRGAAEEAAALDAVWARVAQAGAYRFSADIRQTSTPPATVVNAGRTSQSTTLHMEGAADLPAESLQLTVWTNGGSVMDPASGVEVRVNGDSAVARQTNGQWGEIEGFAGLFAPGGDLMGYTQAATDVVAHGTTMRETPWGELAVTRYTFAIDGRQLAIYLHDQLMKQAVLDGLPAGVQADFTKAYADMTGTGELWVGDDGLPLRQVLSLTFPPDTRGYVTTAAITVDFFDFAPVPTRTASHRAGHAIVSGRRGVPGRQALMSGIVVGIGLLFVALVIGQRRNRMIYAAVVASMIASILVVPLLNSRRVYAYSAEQVAKQARAMQLRADADAQAAVQDVLAAPRMKPDRAPLAAAQEQAAATDDPSRYADARCESDPDGDPDGDTLTNLEECLLGTLLDVADSDGDGADDNFEVTGVVYNGITWYSDPLYPDSNHDGLPDGKEWFTDADANGEAELDTDGDGTPDIWDNDNDGDGVIDKLDMSPQTSTASTSATVRTFTDADPLELTLDQLEVGELVKVEFQLRPENPAHLWYSQNVLNWPQGDQQGNIQDADGKTFYDIDNTTSPSPNANGDVRMVPMLEITFQEADANLPPAATCTDDDGNNYTCYPLLEDFGISVTTLDDNDSVAYVPLQLVADSTGDANVAFYGRMMYEASGSWSTPHQVRMVWAVQALNDICAEYTNNICTSYSSYNEIQVVHTYYDDWFLTGLHLTEEHSANMALVYEDPVETSKVQPGYDAPFYTDVQFGLLYGLDKTLMAGRCAPLSTDGGCDAGATRDFTVADVYNRFNHTTNSAVSATARWNLPNVLGVEYNEYESIDLGLLDTTITQTVRILDDHFTGAWTTTAPITPTIMSVYEQQYRDLNLDQSMTGSSHVAWNGNDLTLSLPQSGSDAVGVDTMVSLKWTPYAYDPVTGWAAADIQQYWNSLNADWGPSFVDPQYPGQAETYQTLAQHQYMSVYSGANTVVQMGDVVIPASYQAPDETIADEFGIDTTNYALKATVAYYGVSDDLAEVATYLRSIGLENNIALFSVGTYIQQKVIELYNNLGKVGFVAGVAALAIVALVMAVTYFVSLTVHNTGVRWTFAISAGILLFTFTVVSKITGYVSLLDKIIMGADETITYGTAVIRSLSEISTISNGAEVFGVLGLLLAAGVAIGFFIAAWANGSAKPGSIAFNEGVAVTIATVLVSVLFFAVGLLVLGGLVVAILTLVDTVLQLAGIKWSITGWLTEGIARAIYTYDIYTTQSQQTGALENTLLDPAAGLTAGVLISFTLPITTTLKPAGSVKTTDPRFRENSLIYALSPVPESLATATNSRANDWIATGDEARITDYPTVQIPLTAGVNTRVPLQLNAAWALGATSCWVGYCQDAPVVGNSSTAVDDGMIFDVLPQTIDEFVDVTTLGWSFGRLDAVDADGDGLLSQEAGGLDPDDGTWDADGDGLSDSYELSIRSLPGDQGGQDLDPLDADTDNDTIIDSLELFWGTDPGSQDSDDDGIADVEELPPFGGWQLPYAPDKSTRVWSDPLDPDDDGDGLSDLFERTQVTCPTCQPWADKTNPAVFNPNVWNLSPVALYVDDSSVDGYVRPGATVVYTSTTVNNLSGGQDLIGNLSVDVPAGFSAEGTEITVDVNSGETESLVTTLTVDATTSVTGSMASTMQLTDFDSTVWSWDAPLTSKLTGADAVQAIAAVALTGWSDPVLQVAREIGAGGLPQMVARVTSVAGDVRQSVTLATSTSSALTMTEPDIACTDEGACMVVWAQTDVDQTSTLWISLMPGRLPATAATRQVWKASGTSIQTPTVATNDEDFMLTWATEAAGTATLWSLPLDSTGGPKYVYPDEEPSAVVDPVNFRSGTGLSSPQSNWNGTSYGAVWVENGSIMRADLNVETGEAAAPKTIHAGQGWPQSEGLSRAPETVHDPVSLQSLLLYRGADNHFYAGQLNAADAFTLLALDTTNDFSTAGVQTALCADPKNGGWVAAWALPGDGIVNYQAVGPDGTLRGERQQVSQPATSGLALACSTARPVVDLDFEEAEGATSFTDASGFGNDATCVAGTCPVAGVQGRFGRAVHFNGAGEYLQVPNDPAFNFTRDQDFTVSFWVLADGQQQDTNSADVSIVSKWENDPVGYPFVVRYLHATGQVHAARYDGVNSAGVQSTQGINDSQFHHVVFVKNGATLALYIDGEQSGATVTDNTTGDTTNTFPLFIGSRGGQSNFFTGTVDRLQIFPRALSIQEIGGIYDAAAAIYDLDEPAGSQTFVDGSGNELTGLCTKDSTGDTCPAMGSPGVAYTAATFDGVDDAITVAPIKRVVNSYTYDFEDGVGPEWSADPNNLTIALNFQEAAGATLFADFSGGGHNAVCASSTCPTAGVTGHVGLAVQFNGTSEYLTIPNDSAFNFAAGQNFTVAFWVKTAVQQDTARTDNSIVEKWSNDGGSYPFVVRYVPATGKVYAARFDGTHQPVVTSAKSINDGQFHHVAFVKAGGTLTLYIDGVQSGNAVTDTATGTTTNAYPLYLGMRGGSAESGGTNHFAGTLDQLRIFAQALDAAQINQVALGTVNRLAPNGPGETYWTGGGDYWLGDFDNERVSLTLTDLPAHDTVKVRFNLITPIGFSDGWEGNMTAEGRGPDRWEWGYGSTAILNTSFAVPDSSQCDSEDPSCWGFTQAYPGAYVAQVADGLEIGVPVQPQFFYQDVANFAGTAVGDNPQFGWTSVLYQSAAKVYENPNYAGASQIFDPFVGTTSLNAQWPSWVSSMRIWPAQHGAQAGSIASSVTASALDGPIYAIANTISDHTADAIAVYFQGQTATTDPGGPEIWALDNVQVTLERDETSIPLNNQSFTLAAWAKRSATGNWDPIITQGANGTDQHLYFGFRGDQPNLFTCAFSKVGDALDSPQSYTDLDWHHWVCTYEVTTNIRILYRDGVEIARDTAAGSHSGLGITYIGRNGSAETFHGQIDEIGVWRQPLAAADVAALYNKVKAEDQSVMVGTLFAADGSTTVVGSEVVLRETATNVGTVKQTTARTLTVDPDKPTVCPDANQCPLNGQYVQNRGTLIVAGTAQDPTSYVDQVEVDNGGWQALAGTGAWSYAWDISALADGGHALAVRAYDAVGDVSQPYSMNVIIDSTPPQLAFTTGMANAQRPSQDDQGNWSVTLAGTVSDPNAGSQPGSGVTEVHVLLDGSGTVAGQGWQSAALTGGNWTIDYVLPSLDDSGSSQIDPSGVYTVSIRAADAVGNLTPPDAYLTGQLRLDAEAPDVTLTAPVSGMQLITTALTLSGDVSDVSVISAVEVNLTPAEQMDALGGAVLHLPFDERRPTGLFTDESGAGHAATCTANCPAVNEPGQRDRAVGFNGTSQYLTLPTLFDPAETAFTVAVWFNTATLGQGPMVQQRDGTKVGRAWLYTGADGTIQTYLGGSTVAGTTKVTTGEWHHAAVSYDGVHLAIYLDGALETRVARTMESSDGTMLIGVGKNLNSFFNGQLDELVIYDRALADYEIADLYGYGQGVWAPATVEGGGWRFSIPEGAEGIEGYYQINGRGIDTLENVTPQSEQRLWRGEIDTKPPEVSTLVNENSSGGVTTTTYTCAANDFNLDAASSCVATGGIPSFRAGDITLTTYDQVDPWFAATITDTSRLYGMDAVRVYSATAVTGMNIQACDIYGRCTTVQPDLAAGPPPAQSARLLAPSPGAVLTTLDPVTLSGHAYDWKGLDLLFVKVNERTAFFKSWRDDETGANWDFTWTPPTEGIYRITPLLAEAEGEVPLQEMAVSAEPGVADDLPFHSYVPLAMDAATPTRHMSFLPIAHKPVTARDIFTGTTAILYVDLTPPTVAIETTLLTQEQALGQQVVELSGPVADATLVYMVEISIDGGPWDMAGVASGRWRYPWIVDGAADGTRHTVSVRALDVADHTAEVTADVTLDVVAPAAGAVNYGYVTAAGATVPMRPGDHVVDAVGFVVTWEASPDDTGSTRYLVGFSTQPVPHPDELTTYTTPGRHTEPVTPGDRRYAVVRYMDEHGNTRTVEAGPFFVD